MPYQITPLRALGLALCASLALGCQESSGDDEDESPPAYAQKSVGLHAFPTCDALLDYLHAEAGAEVERFGAVRGGGGVDADVGRGAPTAEPQGEGGGEGGSNGGPSYSRTNVQEGGVDEPDRVKTDGLTLYVARGSQLLAYDASDLSLLSETQLVAQDAQLLLDGDTLVVLGQRWGAPEEDFAEADQERLQRGGHTVVALWDVSDPATPELQRRSYIEGYLQSARLVDRTLRAAIFHNAADRIVWDVEQQGGAVGGGGSTGGSGGSAPPRTTVETEPAPPEDSSEASEDDETDFAEKQAQDWQAAWQAAIDETVITDWLPHVYTATGEAREVRLAARCESTHRPGERAGTGFATVFSLDLDRPDVHMDDPAIVTGTGVVYASATALYLSTSNHFGWGRGGDVAVGVGRGAPGEPVEATVDAPTETRTDELRVPDDERAATQIHKLDISDSEAPAAYRASGRVFGLPLNQFSLGEHEAHLRIATTEEDWQRPDGESLNHVFVLGETAAEDDEAAPAALEITGQVTDLAPGERIYSVRFVGARGFVVTFRQVDPLFTLDLSDPTDPRLLGELKVLGFSTYLHPFGEDHLIGVGQSATEEGRVTGLQLSLFDVSDLSDPTLAHKSLLGEGWSEALYDHHAFTLWEDTLMVPVHGWDGEQAQMGLNVYQVSLDDGFVAEGHVSHADLMEGWHPHVSRSVVIGDAVYSVSDVGMKANGLEDLMERGRCVFPEAPEQDRPNHGVPEPIPEGGVDGTEEGEDEGGRDEG